jgi:hypothetical protein
MGRAPKHVVLLGVEPVSLLLAMELTPQVAAGRRARRGPVGAQ